MKYPGAIGPALRVYGQVVKAHWPALLALTIAYPLLNWGATVAWKAMPVASGWVELGLTGGQMLIWALAWGLMGAVLAQLALATSDGRPANGGALLRACADALPVVAVMVLLTNVSSLPLNLWRTHLAGTGEIGGAAFLIGLLSLLFAILDFVVFWLLAMAVPVRLDQELSLISTLKTSAGYGRRRWKTMLLVFVAAVVGLMTASFAVVIPSFASQAANGGDRPPLLTDSYLWKVPVQMVSVAWTLFWPALYVTFREQEGTGAVAETFD